MLVDPLQPENFGKPLWNIHGHKAFPAILCCKISNQTEFGPTIWGFSIWKRSPGFRTLGINVSTWAKGKELCEFYDSQEEALDRLRVLTTPKGAK